MLEEVRSEEDVLSNGQEVRSHMTQCINRMVLERRLPHKIVNKLFEGRGAGGAANKPSEDIIRANGTSQKWTPLRKLPESSSIPRKLSKHLPSTRLQGGEELRMEDDERSKRELRSEEEVIAEYLEELRSNAELRSKDEALGELPLDEDQLRGKAKELRVKGELRSEADLRSAAGELEELRSKDEKLGEVRTKEELRTKDDERSTQKLRSEAEEAELRSKAEELRAKEEELEVQRSKEELRSNDAKAEELRSKAELQAKKELRAQAEELRSREEELRSDNKKLEELRSKAEDLRLKDASLNHDSTDLSLGPAQT